MQWGKYMVSTACQGSPAVAMQGEGCLRASTGHRVWAVACACHLGTPPPFLHRNCPRNPPGTPILYRNPPPFLHRNHPRNPPGTPFLHRNPPPSCTGTPLPGPLPRPFLDPSCTGTPPLPAQEPPFLDPFLDPSWTLPAQEPPPLSAQEPPSWTTSCPLSSLAFPVLLFRRMSTCTRGWS